MKRKRFAAMLGAVLITVSGCTESHILRPETGQSAPDFSIVTDVEIQWEQVSDDVLSCYEDSIDYSGLLTFNFAHKDEEKLITAQLFVDDSVSGKKAADYASDLIRFINDSIAIQNKSLALSTSESYGGFFDDYSFTVQVIPELSQDDESTWLVNMTVSAGEHTPIVPLT